MKKIKKLQTKTIAVVGGESHQYPGIDEVLEKQCEIIDSLNKHQEEHDKTPEEYTQGYSHGYEERVDEEKRHQAKETKAEKIAEVIKDYAHDYRDMELDEPHFGAMLKEFLEAIETL